MKPSARTTLMLALAAAASTGCERTPTPAGEAGAPAGAAAPARADNGFEVEVTLSEAAARALAAGGESVVVSADYFGYPTVAAQQRELPGTGDGWLSLHERKLELEGAGRVAFAPVNFDAGQLQLIERGQPQLLINVYSGRRSSEDNLLDCGTFQDALAVAVRSGVHIECKLIAE
ncbi:hypothetical protein QFW77_16390 [Luteimonas sp. RD2P54]|uniref:Cyclophilin-like domain-containing protein n=1 Tax=Luteimonas endophytica TaxID=3042023 RepID=A0ABT6JCS3_9GAMM|nr:hypothetical protein [Luteimonas endophytica]MDH5824554.1 hypothetical protein [Luteimonas endophytica]